MGREVDRLVNRIDCLDTANIAATLIDTAGYHCEVWRCIGVLLRNGGRERLDFVIKIYRRGCTLPEIRLYRRQYRMLKDTLGDIVPDALFVATAIDGQASVMVLAETARPWFSLANPNNESELVPLLTRLPRARRQLARFLDAAAAWQQADEPRVIDLYGSNNLILDKNYNVKYIDSFEVFFLPDMLKQFGADTDTEFAERVELARQRQDYLRYVLDAARTAGRG